MITTQTGCQELKDKQSDDTRSRERKEMSVEIDNELNEVVLWACGGRGGRGGCEYWLKGVLYRTAVDWCGRGRGSRG